uniref:Uncharacterized protein n=1 Tax=Candidatus Kentrum sp. UNK TaxID=2126344 RepID=A0A451B3Z2_9GAMM|nr:MAG: hypothetical protein BECKUNK1418G_GA0071005_11573 [Candidatus Kentron sp. UNK]VFK72967.1 MAG: hypothetical protein BECKUNK1418H_GA0071006_11533 [Candidatus Kentron sp. UNK]
MYLLIEKIYLSIDGKYLLMEKMYFQIEGGLFQWIRQDFPLTTPFTCLSIHYPAFPLAHRKHINGHFSIVHLIGKPVTRCSQFDFVGISQPAKSAGRYVGLKNPFR